MAAKGILQTFGTVSSFIFAFITLNFTRNNQNYDLLKLGDVLGQYGHFIFILLTIGIMMITGFSYYDSRLEHEGFTYFLYFCTGIAHTLLAPIAFVIAIMKIDFGQYWWAVLVGIILLIYWGSQHRESQD